MELRVLRYFLAVIREENITRAAEALHITQPTLSRQLAELEEELGTQLFERGKRKIVLTESGILLRRRAEEMIALAEKTEQELSAPQKDIQGTIAIGSGESESANILPVLIDSYTKMYPNVKFELHTGVAEEIRDRLDKGLLDIGLLIEPVEIEKYEYIRLPEKEILGVMVSKDDPLSQKEFVTAEDLVSRRLIGSCRMNQKNIKKWFGKNYPDIDLFCTCDLAANASLLVEKGIAVSFTIKGAVSNYNNVLFKPLFPAIESSSVLVWKKYQPFSPAASRFIELIKDTCKA